MTFGADIIAGFPTETEAHFENSLALVRECDLTWLHVFPYSPRPGTPAARMPQVDGAAIKERAARLRAAGEAQVARHLAAQVGRAHAVLMESPRMGRTEQFTEVAFDAPRPRGRSCPRRSPARAARSWWPPDASQSRPFAARATGFNLDFAREQGFGMLAVAAEGAPLVSHIPSC